MGSNRNQASRLTRQVIEALHAAGWELAVWMEGEAEPEWPWGLDQPGPVPGSFAVTARAEAATSMAEYGPIAFLLQIDHVPPDAALLTAASFGVWRFATPGPGPLGFWEVYDGLFHMELRLDRIVDAERSTALDRRWIRVDRLSYPATLNAAIGELAEMVVYAARLETSAPDSRRTDRPEVFPPWRNQAPSVWERSRLQAKLWWRLLLDQGRGILFSEAWKVGLIDAPVTEFLDLGYLPEIRWLPSPSNNRFLADPFLLRVGVSGFGRDGWLLLAEDFDFTTNVGRIVQEFSSDGTFTGHIEPALAEPCHMSYPFPLELDGELYCIPETHQKNGVYAWRWNRSSRQWVEPRELIAGRQLVDSTLVFFEDRWWLFATDKANGADSKLHLFYAPSPWGPWQPHARNPVKVDIRSSRPGGRPFLHGGMLYRPAQDSSKHYGWRLVVNQVTRLTPTEFSEEVIRVVDSDRLRASGVHTLSQADGRTVIDAWTPRFVPWRIPVILSHKFWKLTKAIRGSQEPPGAG